MKFGAIPIEESAGAILAHKLYDANGRMVFNKGHILVDDDIAVLRGHKLETVIVTQLSPSDLHEDAAAEQIGNALVGQHIEMRTSGLGRANLTAGKRGVLHVNVPALDILNNIYDGITIATLPKHTLVNEGEMVALVKIVPFGVPEVRVLDVERIAESTQSILSIRPLESKRVALIISGTESTRDRLMNSFHAPVRNRIEGWGSTLLEPVFVLHNETAIADAIQAQTDVDMILVASISAIMDRDDVVPSALVKVGGSLTIHGVPVDPGTLLMMGYIGEVPVVGVPGCIKSPKTNVVDWILPRLLTGERLTRADFVSMGHGGLLQDIPDRPAPRHKKRNG